MTGNSDERLSALLDGELEGREEQQAIDLIIAGEPVERAQFGRYRLIGDVMRGETALLGSGVDDRVRTALAEEPTVLAPPPKVRKLARPLAGLAIAASVAATAVMIAPQFLSDPTGANGGGVTIASAPISPSLEIQPPAVAVSDAGYSITQPPTRNWQTLDPVLGERLNRLVIEHHEYGGRTGVNGPVAHIGLVNYAGR